MRLVKVDISDIIFEYKTYSEDLYHSIKRIGFSFPIQLNKEDDKYICRDGHKRLSILSDILKVEPDYHRGSQVSVIIKNNEDTRSNDCWRGRNTH